MVKTMDREQQRAMFANLSNRKTVPVAFLRPINSTERRASEFTVIPLGAGREDSKQHGLPIFRIGREDALRLRKKNSFEIQSGGGHRGDISVEEFKKLVEKSPKAFSQFKTTKEKELKKLEVAEKKEKPLPKEKEGTSEDPHQIPQTALTQLEQSKVNGFPFFKFTGIKGFLLLGNDTLQLKDIPRNPNGITRVSIIFDKGQDLYNLLFFKKRNKIMIPSKRIDGIFFDQMAEIIAREMGVL